MFRLEKSSKITEHKLSQAATYTTAYIETTYYNY